MESWWFHKLVAIEGLRDLLRVLHVSTLWLLHVSREALHRFSAMSIRGVLKSDQDTNFITKLRWGEP